MELKELLKDDGAVSPVIGVILMVAITVILAAVIAAFVLGLGDTSSVGPQVSFDYDYDEASGPSATDGSLEIRVSSGDTFEAQRVSFSGTNVGDFQSAEDWADDNTLDSAPAGDTSTVGAGDRVEGSGLGDDFELEIVWTSEGGGDSNVLSTRTGPDA